MTEKDSVREQMTAYVQRNSLDVSRMLSSRPEGEADEKAAPREADFGVLVGTKKEGASLKEKQMLMRARRQRTFATILARGGAGNKPKDLKYPKGTLEPKGGAVQVAKNVGDLKKPYGVYDSNRFFCECEGCASNRETQLKADKWWLSGDRDRAMSYVNKPCLRQLPVAYNSIVRRPRRARMPKKPNHKSVLWRAVDGIDFNDTFARKPNKSTNPTSVDDYETIDQAIADTEAQLRRMVGSADWCAEVVVVVTSLTANRNAYQESYRLLRFFEAKGVEHIAIDVNADIGHDSVDYKLLRKWCNEHLLLIDANKLADKVTLPIIVPQVLIDGVPVGPIEEIMTLEAENDLDYILAREACPNCLANRTSSAGHCGRCSALYKDLISLKYMAPQDIRLLLLRSEQNACHIKAPTPYDWEKRRIQLGLKTSNEDTATWFTPDCLKKYGTPSVGFCVDFN